MTKYQLKTRLHSCKPRHEALSELHQANVDTFLLCVVADKRELREEGIEESFKNRRKQRKARPRPGLLSISFWRDNAGNVRIFALCSFIVSQPGQRIGLY